MKKKTYMITLLLQPEEAKKWCYGAGCGKGLRGLAGGVTDFGPIGSGIMCQEKSCPHLKEAQASVPIIQLKDGTKIYLRILKNIKESDRENVVNSG